MLFRSEGYVESAASGILAAVHAYNRLSGKPAVIPPATTVCGALSRHISSPNADFQPMNANFGILPPPEQPLRDKKQRYARLAERALKDIGEFKREINI